MNKILENNKYIYLLLIFSLYFIGFFLRENIAGGAENDFSNFTWPVILSFKSNFYLTLKNYSKFSEGTLPLFHIINAYLNPFTISQFLFQGSIMFISLLNIFFFSKILEEKFNLLKIDSYLYASIFLLLPFFRSSAFWGITENFGWMFLLLAILYFNRYLINKKNNLTVFYICLFSSFALYTRPYLIFFPLFVFSNAILSKDTFLLKRLTFFYSFMALPGLYLLYLWGGYIYIGEGETKINLIKDFHNPKFIIKNLVPFASIYFFYLIPFEIIKFFNKKKINFKSILTFFIILMILLIFNYLNFFNYLNKITIGGGIFLKLSKLFFEYNYILLLIFASLGFRSIYEFILISKKNLLLFLSLLIYCFPKFILHEYFEPLIIILFFSIIDLGKNYKKIFSKNLSIYIFLIFFLSYYFLSFFYRYYFAN